MLVLSRRDREKIVFELPGGQIVEVEVLGFNGVVKLGINAPSDVRILRKELHDRFAAGEPQRRRFPH